MNKSIYSLVLSDEVIEAIDRMAYSMNTSRSALINQILAEAVSYVTPEKRMRDIFGRMEEILLSDNAFQLMMQSSDSMFSVRSALAYKYNPTIKYSLELNKEIDKEIGKLKISLRTQNRTLILYLAEFFKLLATLEEKYLGMSGICITDGKFTKILKRRSEEALNEERLAVEISDYINLIDNCIKMYFANLEYKEETAQKIERMYLQYLKNHSIVA